MPQRKNAIKAHKQNQARRLHNLDIKTDIRKTVKEFTAVAKTDAKKAATLLANVYKKFDKAAKRNIMSKNTASRRKARYAKLVNAASKEKA